MKNRIKYNYCTIINSNMKKITPSKKYIFRAAFPNIRQTGKRPTK